MDGTATTFSPVSLLSTFCRLRLRRARSVGASEVFPVVL